MIIKLWNRFYQKVDQFGDYLQNINAPKQEQWNNRKAVMKSTGDYIIRPITTNKERKSTINKLLIFAIIISILYFIIDTTWVEVTILITLAITLIGITNLKLELRKYKGED